jgi:hypothetical protein
VPKRELLTGIVAYFAKAVDGFLYALIVLMYQTNDADITLSILIVRTQIGHMAKLISTSLFNYRLAKKFSPHAF